MEVVVHAQAVVLAGSTVTIPMMQTIANVQEVELIAILQYLVIVQEVEPIPIAEIHVHAQEMELITIHSQVAVAVRD
jgi:hypothetical protein